jgi:hypothetical protein
MVTAIEQSVKFFLENFHNGSDSRRSVTNGGLLRYLLSFPAAGSSSAKPPARPSLRQLTSSGCRNRFGRTIRDATGLMAKILFPAIFPDRPSGNRPSQLRFGYGFTGPASAAADGRQGASRRRSAADVDRCDVPALADDRATSCSSTQVNYEWKGFAFFR